jgi:hypothetical protein
MYSEGLITVIPMVKTRKKVPINSATRALTLSTDSLLNYPGRRVFGARGNATFSTQRVAPVTLTSFALTDGKFDGPIL